MWISSITTISPLLVRPNSYLVSTRMSPRSAHTSWPCANSAMAYSAAASKSRAVTAPDGDDLFARHADVVVAVFGLGAGREDRLRASFSCLRRPSGKRWPQNTRVALLVVGPDAGRGVARDVGAHDHLDLERLALDADHHVRIGHREHVVGRDALGLVEPPRRQRVEHLPLVGQRTEHAVEGADAIGDDQDALAVGGGVVVADFAFVACVPSPAKLVPSRVFWSPSRRTCWLTVMAVGAFHCWIERGAPSSASAGISSVESARSMIASACWSAWPRSNWASISGSLKRARMSASALRKAPEIALAAKRLHRVALHEHVAVLAPHAASRRARAGCPRWPTGRRCARGSARRRSG